MITIQQFGAETTAEWLKSKVRLFQAEQKIKMRAAANLVKVDVIHEAQNVFASRGFRKRADGSKRGPIDRNIGVKVFSTTLDVVALVRPRARAFHGRFQETGLDVQRKGRIVSTTTSLLGRKKSVRAASHPFHLPAKPFLGPVAERDAGKVTEVLGDSYRVFQDGGS